jgi:hypothetical protein
MLGTRLFSAISAVDFWMSGICCMIRVSRFRFGDRYSFADLQEERSMCRKVEMKLESSKAGSDLVEKARNNHGGSVIGRLIINANWRTTE